MAYFQSFSISLILTVLSSISGLKFQSFSQFCNASTPCNKSALLTCLDSTCSCIFPESMTFIPDLGACFSLPGERCGALDFNGFDSQHVKLPCVPHAFCNRNAECECRSTHYQDALPSGLCLPKGGIGEVCGEDRECESGFCSGKDRGTCDCRPGHALRSSLFSPEIEGDEEEEGRSSRCLVKPGKPCEGKELCVPNAACLGGKCKCGKGFKPSRNEKFCVGVFNSTCDSGRNMWCEKGLACVDGRCSCPRKWDQVWNKEESRCLTLTGGACKVTENCVENAICREETRSCECSSSFVENGERTCDLREGMPCSSSSSPNKTGPKCDSLAGLQCINGSCTCPFGVYEDGVCAQLIGGFCTKRGPKCVWNGVCKLGRGGLLPFGRCLLDEGKRKGF